MTVERNRFGFGIWPGRDLWRQWVLASAVGCFVGIFLGSILYEFLGYALANVLGNIIGEDVIGSGLLNDMVDEMLFGAGFGFGLSGLQWFVVRQRFSRAGWWVLASTTGFALAFVGGSYFEMLGSLESFAKVLDYLVVVALGGAVTGILQWLFLRGQVSRPGRWVLASTVGWGLGMAVWGALLIVSDTDVTRLFLGPLFAGSVLGVVTGVALVWLLRQPVPEA